MHLQREYQRDRFVNRIVRGGGLTFIHCPAFIFGINGSDIHEMKITYYRDPFGSYHGITDESPNGLAGCVYVGRGPDERGIETVKERAYAINVLQKWTRVDEVPDEWLEAIGYEKVREYLPEPPPQVKTVKLKFKRSRDIIPEAYTKDPVFWILCMTFFVVYYVIMKHLI